MTPWLTPAANRLTPAAEAPLRIGDKVIVDAATPYQRRGVIIAIRRSEWPGRAKPTRRTLRSTLRPCPTTAGMPPKYVVEFDIGLGRRRSEFDIDRSRLRISGPGGYSCAVM